MRQITVLIRDRQYEALKAESKEAEKTISEQIRTAIQAYLRRLKQKKKKGVE